MIEFPNWKMVKIISDSNQSREILITSDTPASDIKEHLLVVRRKELFLKTISVPKTPSSDIFPLSNQSEIILKIRIPDNLEKESCQKIFTFFQETCKNRNYTEGYENPNFSFNTVYSFKDLEILLFLLTQKLLSLYSGIEKSDYEKIKFITHTVMPYHGNPCKNCVLWIGESLNPSFENPSFKNAKKLIEEKIEDFILWIEPEEKNYWILPQFYSSPNNERVPCHNPYMWRSNQIDSRTLETTTSHKILKFKKIIKKFLESSANYKQ